VLIDYEQGVEELGEVGPGEKERQAD